MSKIEAAGLVLALLFFSGCVGIGTPAGDLPEVTPYHATTYATPNPYQPTPAPTLVITPTPRPTFVTPVPSTSVEAPDVRVQFVKDGRASLRLENEGTASDTFQVSVDEAPYQTVAMSPKGLSTMWVPVRVGTVITVTGKTGLSAQVTVTEAHLKL